MLIESRETVFILEGKCPFTKGLAFRWNSFIGNLNAGIITFRTNSGIIRCIADETFLNYTIKNEFSDDKTITGINPFIGRLFKPKVFEIIKN